VTFAASQLRPLALTGFRGLSPPGSPAVLL